MLAVHEVRMCDVQKSAIPYVRAWLLGTRPDEVPRAGRSENANVENCSAFESFKAAVKLKITWRGDLHIVRPCLCMCLVQSVAISTIPGNADRPTTLNGSETTLVNVGEPGRLYVKSKCTCLVSNSTREFVHVEKGASRFN